MPPWIARSVRSRPRCYRQAQRLAGNPLLTASPPSATPPTPAERHAANARRAPRRQCPPIAVLAAQLTNAANAKTIAPTNPLHTTGGAPL